MSEDQYSQEVTRAGWLIRVGQYGQTVQILAYLLVGYSDNAGITYKVMVLVHNNVNRFGGAEAVTRKVLAVQPNGPNTRRFLAEVPTA